MGRDSGFVVNEEQNGTNIIVYSVALSLSDEITNNMSVCVCRRRTCGCYQRQRRAGIGYVVRLFDIKVSSSFFVS